MSDGMKQGKFDYIGEYREGLAFVRNNIKEFKVGFIDEAGNVVIPLDYYGRVTVDGRERLVHFPFFSEGLTAVMNADGKFGYIDRHNNTVVPFCYDDARPFTCGLAAVKKNGRYGFINSNGEEILSLEYDWAGEFSELAPVRRGDKLGFVNKRGDIVVPFVINYKDVYLSD